MVLVQHEIAADEGCLADRAVLPRASAWYHLEMLKLPSQLNFDSLARPTDPASELQMPDLVFLESYNGESLDD